MILHVTFGYLIYDELLSYKLVKILSICACGQVCGSVLMLTRVNKS